ncbi:hypothetical protein ACP4OV_023500 [Aristida adscensionis]
MGHLVIAMLLCFLCASYHLNSARARPMDVGGSPSGNTAGSPAPGSTFLANHAAGWSTILPQPYYGTRAKISVWGSSPENSQESGAGITISTGSYKESFNCIEAGFEVFPDLYNDSDVHFFTYWTRDGFESTGCYNLRCPGFVPASGAALVPGQAVTPASTYGGEDRFITINLHMDPNTGDWVLYRDELNTPSLLGHFPKELFSKLNGGGGDVGWFGFVHYRKTESSPPMGSGHFPAEGARKAAYFKNIQLFDSKANAYDPKPSELTRVFTRQDCYNVSELFHAKDDGVMFYYGGPRGCTSRRV